MSTDCRPLLARMGYAWDHRGVLRNVANGLRAWDEMTSSMIDATAADLVQGVLEDVQGRILYPDPATGSRLDYIAADVPRAADEALHPKARIKIYLTRNWKRCEKMLIIIQGHGGVRPGIWSRSLCLESNLQAGSMLGLLERAAREGYGVAVLNPNENTVKVQDERSFHVQVRKLKNTYKIFQSIFSLCSV